MSAKFMNRPGYKHKSKLSLILGLFLLAATIGGAWHEIEPDLNSGCVFTDSLQRADSTRFPCQNPLHDHHPPHRGDKCLLCRFARNGRVRLSVQQSFLITRVAGDLSLFVNPAYTNSSFSNISDRAPPALG
ncbi:MAG: hypothetical protein ACE5GM_10630 [bacterium]